MTNSKLKDLEKRMEDDQKFLDDVDAMVRDEMIRYEAELRIEKEKKKIQRKEEEEERSYRWKRNPFRRFVFWITTPVREIWGWICDDLSRLLLIGAILMVIATFIVPVIVISLESNNNMDIELTYEDGSTKVIEGVSRTVKQGFSNQNLKVFFHGGGDITYENVKGWRCIKDNTEGDE